MPKDRRLLKDNKLNDDRLKLKDNKLKDSKLLKDRRLKLKDNKKFKDNKHLKDNKLPEDSKLFNSKRSDSHNNNNKCKRSDSHSNNNNHNNKRSDNHNSKRSDSHSNSHNHNSSFNKDSIHSDRTVLQISPSPAVFSIRSTKDKSKVGLFKINFLNEAANPTISLIFARMFSSFIKFNLCKWGGAGRGGAVRYKKSLKDNQIKENQRFSER